MPPSDDEAGDIRQFLREHIESYEQLEVLLLVVRHAERRWTAEAVSQKLYLQLEAAGAALTHLHARGLLEVGEPVDYGYAPSTPELKQGVENLVKAYAKDRLMVMERMSANVLQRRTSALQAFSDAFRLRGPKKDG